MAEKQQEWELLPRLWIGTMNSYLQVNNFMGPEKMEELLRGWKPMYCKGQVQQIKAWLKNQCMLSENQKNKLAQGKANSPVEAPQAATSKNQPQQVSNNDKETPESNKKGKQKAKGKEKSKCTKPYPQNYRTPKKQKTAMENVFIKEKNSDGIQKQGGANIEPIFSKEVELVKLLIKKL
ncbi:hypothetical protein O181_042742 [Austropuccinia psidii MF-1]|uniref:Uncharacterized protein n=1 Tax=Austropuccinia psidii MF-1 TaxID=1389203 RepID=A0A9Q3DNF0_9BASI|nr:hypothetical protein [Austropuccinia psidii MF-1]